MNNKKDENKTENDNRIVSYIKSNYINIILLIIGFLIAFKVNYQRNPNSKQALMLIFNNKCYHIHHWVTYGLIILIILASKHLKNKYLFMIIYFLLGLISEDFLYRNILQFRQSCNKMF
jgi:hypothetical protein